MESLGQIIKDKRVAKGLLLRQVAAHIDVDPSILSKIENGIRKPSRENILKLAEILQVKREDLMVEFLCEKIALELAGEDFADKALKIAGQRLKVLRKSKRKS